jgi:rod shape-determining protein MreC
MAMLFYSPKRPITNRRKKIILLSPKTLCIGLLLISLFFLLFQGTEKFSPPTSPIARFLSVPITAIQSLRNFCVGMANRFQDNFDAKNRLTDLRKEVDDLRQENQELRYKLRRHEHYREAFELKPEEGMPVVTAIVMMMDDRMTKSLIIKRGAEDGLDINMPVLSNEGLVGRITQKITQHAAQVQPLTDPRSAVGVYVKGSPYEGILRGTEDGKNLLLTDLFLSGVGDETIRPKPGDKLYTTGHGLVFPRDILAGVINDATDENNWVVKPVVNINSIKAVMVLTRTQLQEEMLSLLNDK